MTIDACWKGWYKLHYFCCQMYGRDKKNTVQPVILLLHLLVVSHAHPSQDKSVNLDHLMKWEPELNLKYRIPMIRLKDSPEDAPTDAVAFRKLFNLHDLIIRQERNNKKREINFQVVNDD